MNTWNPITNDSDIQPGDIIGGYNSSGAWCRCRVTDEMARERDYLLANMEATHWTQAAPFWGIPMPPGIEDCEVMEVSW